MAGKFPLRNRQGLGLSVQRPEEMEVGSFLSPGQLDPGATEGPGGGGPVALRGGADGGLPVLPHLQACLQDKAGPRHCPPLQDRAMKDYYSQQIFIYSILKIIIKNIMKLVLVYWSGLGLLDNK